MTKSRADALELSLVTGGLMVAMIAVMWAQRPAADCTLPFDPPRQLVLTRETDREHLATDVASADRVARRYMGSSGDAAQQRARFLACEATLVDQIATRHGVSTDRVRASLTSAQ